jgi:hypothetical protein
MIPDIANLVVGDCLFIFLDKRTILVATLSLDSPHISLVPICKKRDSQAFV